MGDIIWRLQYLVFHWGWLFWLLSSAGRLWWGVWTSCEASSC